METRKSTHRGGYRSGFDNNTLKE
ncbi:hypothetical protein VTH82DRAFT_2400 [Thermothelomyces myriococcoides]